jgi:hypothetical protein
MGLVSAFLSGPQEIIPAGQTKVELFVFTHDNLNKGTAKWQIKEGANTYNVTADAGGHGKILVPSGKTYTVTLTISGTYEGGKTTSFVANSCEVVLCHFILGDQVTKSGAQIITGAKHFSAQPTADTRAYNPANKTDLVSIKSLQESSDVVHTSGDEEIAGVKTFINNPIVSGNYANIIMRSGLSNSNIIFHTLNQTGRTTQLRSSDNGVTRAVTQIDTFNNRISATARFRLVADDDGDKWVELPMRSSPGSLDAVNVKYVLDRVAEMTQFTTNEVNKHATKKDNPHAVTKAQVGLGNVHNIAPADMPISTAVQGALDGKANIATTPQKGDTITAYAEVYRDTITQGSWRQCFTPYVSNYVTLMATHQDLSIEISSDTSSSSNTWPVCKIVDSHNGDGRATHSIIVPKGWYYKATTADSARIEVVEQPLTL